MKKFLNLFLSMVLPVSILFIILSVGYFTMDYDLSKALKLGVLSGFLAGVIFAAIISVLLLAIRQARAAHIAKTNPDQAIIHDANNGPINKTFFLLMDRGMAFDLAIQAIIDQKIGEVGKESQKKKGNITAFEPDQKINIHIDPLTKHTAQVSIAADAYSDGVQKIINYIKLKEHAFLQY